MVVLVAMLSPALAQHGKYQVVYIKPEEGWEVAFRCGEWSAPAVVETPGLSPERTAFLGRGFGCDKPRLAVYRYRDGLDLSDWQAYSSAREQDGLSPYPIAIDTTELEWDAARQKTIQVDHATIVFYAKPLSPRQLKKLLESTPPAVQDFHRIDSYAIPGPPPQLK